MWSANDIGAGSAERAGFAGQHGLDADDLAHAARDVGGEVAVEPGYVYIDRQRLSRDRALPSLGHEAALGKELDYARHHPGFRAGLDGKADVEGSGVVSVGSGAKRQGRRHREDPRRIGDESARPEPFWGPGR